MARGITLNGNSMQTFNGVSGIITSEIDLGFPDKTVYLAQLAHSNHSTIPYTDYPSRKITQNGRLIGTSISNLDTLIDTFNSYLTGTDLNLDVDYAGGTLNRRFIATVNGCAFSRPNGLQSSAFSIQYICSNPFGRATSSTNALTVSGRTGASFSDTLTFTGTAPYIQPVITVTFTALSGSGNQVVSFGNGATGQVVMITRIWTTGDIVQVDALNKLITVNGLAVDYLGAFPEFPPGTGTLYYSDTFTSRTFNISVNYLPQYL